MADRAVSFVRVTHADRVEPRDVANPHRTLHEEVVSACNGRTKLTLLRRFARRLPPGIEKHEDGRFPVVSRQDRFAGYQRHRTQSRGRARLYQAAALDVI